MGQAVAKDTHPPGRGPERAGAAEAASRWRATSFDIAHLAGVSQPTVSRALSGSPDVSEATRKRIEAIAAQLDYRPDRNASGLRRRRADTLALLLFEDPTADDSHINPFFVSMLGAITRHAKAAGFDLLVSFQQLSADWHKDYADTHKADGIILLGYGDYRAYRSRLEALVAQGTRFVRWGPVESGQPGVTIGSDNRTGMAEAVRHLLAQGRRHPAFLGDASARFPEFRARWLGFADALAEQGLNPLAAPRAEAISTEDSGAEALHALLDAGHRPDAFVAASDLIALGAIRALAERGVRVPGDVAVIGFDDLPAAAAASPPLTTVQQNTQLAGRLLVEALADAVSGKRIASRMIPTRLVVRQSCGAG